jgi:hypothetical protein
MRSRDQTHSKTATNYNRPHETNKGLSQRNPRFQAQGTEVARVLHKIIIDGNIQNQIRFLNKFLKDS